MTQQRPTPPGWYADPQVPRTQRWWDGSSWTSHTRPVGPTNKRSSSKVWWLIGGIFVVFVVLIVIIGAIAASTSDTATSKSNSATETAETPAPSTVDEAAEASKQAADSSAKAETLARETDRTQFKEVSERDWQLIAKNPDAHVGEKVVIYGKVTQADSATGDEFIRVSTGGQAADYYTINTIAREGVDAVFADVVEGDLVTMWVRVWGSKTYDTTMGGSTTAPEVKVNVIEVTGHE